MQAGLYSIYEKFYEKYHIETMYPGEIKSLSDLDKVDLRFMQNLYTRAYNDGKFKRDKTTLDINNLQMNELVEKISFNLSSILPAHSSDNQPLVDQVGFTAYGTIVQDMHCDYFVPADGLQDKKYPDHFEADKFWGMFMYTFNDKDDLKKEIAPVIYHGLDPEEHHKEMSARPVQQKFCCVFSASTRHAGGINAHPCIRLQVLIDPPPGSTIKFIKDENCVDKPTKVPLNQNRDTLRFRKIRALEHASKPVYKPKILPDFYKELLKNAPEPKKTAEPKKTTELKKKPEPKKKLEPKNTHAKAAVVSKKTKAKTTFRDI
jgi:hypothetical protein